MLPMHRPLVLGCALTALWGALLPACSKDEGDLPDVRLLTPSPSGGSGGSRGAPIGDRCTQDEECASGFCLRADDPAAILTAGTVPGGLCTAACSDHSQCQDLAPGTLCVGFETGSFCVESCRLGTPTAGEVKCGRRAELSCQPLLVDDQGSCSEESPCPAPYACQDGRCTILPACLPRCNGDFDCPESRYCDLWLGECVMAQPTGKLPGDTCDPDAEVDECRGMCLTYEDGVSECAENCTAGAPGGCGFLDQETAPIACAFFAYSLDVRQGVQDEGSCAQRCNCNDDCLGEQLCWPESDSSKAGFCVGGLPLEESLQTCPAD